MVDPRFRIDRDGWGIPRVTADTMAMVMRGQGFATAQDRAWQLEHSRRKALGELAALVGQRGLEWDVLARRMQLADLGRRCFDKLSEPTRQFVAAFVEGINEGLGEARSAEFDELQLRPSPWPVWMPCAVFAVHHLLFATMPVKLWRYHLASKLTPAAAAVFVDEGGQGSGSNSWVVGGKRTRSGYPLIAGDPHRTFEAPGVYQQIRLTAVGPRERFDVAGFTFPGVPGVQHFAHAGEVAWAITNAAADYHDVYVEDLTRDNQGNVWARGPVEPEFVESRQELIEIAGAAPEQVEIMRTTRGPVFHVVGHDFSEAFSLRTPMDVAASVGFEALAPLLRARCVTDVTEALSHWVEPVNNLVVADRAGAARQCVVGAVPARAEANRWSPVPAWDPDSVWSGWVSPLPGRDLEPDEHLVTANHRMPGFAAIGVEFAPPGRANRIDALLEGRDDLARDDMAAIHGDTLAGQPAALWLAIKNLEDVGNLEAHAAKVRDLIVGWDQRFGTDSTAAAAYGAVRDEFVASLAKHPAFAAAEGGASATGNFSSVLAPWFDLPTQLYLSLSRVLGSPGRAALGEDVDNTLRAALAEVGLRLPPGNTRGWGERHEFSAAHGLGWPLGIGVTPVAGDNDSVRCAGARPGSIEVTRGSVARYVWDLAGFSTSGWVVPLGAHGDLQSPHGVDQLPVWLKVRLITP